MTWEIHGDITISSPNASNRIAGAVCFSVKTTEQAPDPTEILFDCLNFGYYTDMQVFTNDENTEYARQFTVADSY